MHDISKLSSDSPITWFAASVALLSLLSGCALFKPNVTSLFSGTDLSGWRALDAKNGSTDAWLTAGSVTLDESAERKRFVIEPGAGLLVNGRSGRTANLVTEREFGDLEAHIEFCCPSDANSGIYVMGMYEIQIRERSHKDVPKLQMRDCGGIFGRWVDEKYVDGHPPLVKAMRGPGEWQSFDIKFRAPRFDANGTKIENARFVEVRLNGQVVQKDVELKGPTRGHLPGEERATGPLLLQGDHGAIAFRNLWVREL